MTYETIDQGNRGIFILCQILIVSLWGLKWRITFGIIIMIAMSNYKRICSSAPLYLIYRVFSSSSTTSHNLVHDLQLHPRCVFNVCDQWLLDVVLVLLLIFNLSLATVFLCWYWGSSAATGDTQLQLLHLWICCSGLKWCLGGVWIGGSGEGGVGQ